MLFLPIDDSIFRQTSMRPKPRGQLAQRRNESQPSVKASKTVNEIQKGSFAAKKLINLMRNARAKDQQMRSNSSLERVMTTMDISIKERLKRNLVTFAPREKTEKETEQKSFYLPKNPVELVLPGWTTNAYEPAYSKPVNRTLRANSRDKMADKMSLDGNIFPYSKDVNDETIIFKFNAPKPLYDQHATANRPHKRLTSAKPSFDTKTSDDEYRSKFIGFSSDRKNGNFTQGRNSLTQLISHSRTTNKFTKVNLIAKQQEVGSLLSAGKSSHFRQKQRTFHQRECELVNVNSRNEEEFSKALRKAPSTMNSKEKKSFFSSNAPYTNQAEILKLETTKEQVPFTVKLCIKCQRSVKLTNNTLKRTTTSPQSKKKTDSSTMNINMPCSVETTERTERQPRPKKVTKETQVGPDLANTFKNQIFTQTQSALLDAQTQYDGLLQAETGTVMSSGRLRKSVEDREVQTVMVERPKTAMVKNLRKKGSDLNGRSFLIVNKEQYDSLISSKTRFQKPPLTRNATYSAPVTRNVTSIAQVTRFN